MNRNLQNLKPLFLVLMASLFFTSCNNFALPDYNEPVKEYLEYWSSTCQIAKVNFISENVTINDIPNLSASKPIEIEIYAINPQKYRLLCKQSGTNFSLSNDNGSLSYSDYSETQSDISIIKIKATLSDKSEGQLITLTGGLWPENRLLWSEDELKDTFHELFTTVKFIQNTPPDNIKNLRVPDNSINNKHYVSFEIPDQSLNRNAGSTYELSYYLREADGNLYYKGTKKVSLSDNRNSSSSDIFFYYFDEQEDYLSYEYTVQVVGPRGLKSELFSTVPGLGVKELCEPEISFTPGLSGNTDNEGYQYIEIPFSENNASYNLISYETGADISGTVDGVNFNGAHNGTLSLGKHTITAKIRKNNCREITVTKKIKVVKELQKPSVSFFSNFTRIYDSADAEDRNYSNYGCYNIDLTLSGTGTLEYNVSPDNAADSVTINVDGSSVTSTGNLALGPHTITLSVSRPDYITKTFTEKVYVQGILRTPEINPVCTSVSGDNYEFSYLTSDTMQVLVNPGNTGNNIEVLLNDSPVGQEFFLEPDASYTVKVKQSRQYCKTPEPLIKTMNVKIKPVTLTFNNHSGAGILDVYLTGFSKDKFDLKGQIRVEYNYYNTVTENYEFKSYIVYSYENSKYEVHKNCWQNLNDSTLRSFTMTFTSPSDEIKVSMSDIRRNVGGGGADERLGGGSKTKQLKDCKQNKDDDYWIFISDAITGNGKGITPRIKFKPAE